MAKRAVVQKVKEQVAEEFRSDWQPKVRAKTAKMGEAIARLASRYGRSTVSIRNYLSEAGLTGHRGRRKPGRPKGSKNKVQVGLRPGPQGNPLARLVALQGRIGKVQAKLAKLEGQRKALAQSPQVQALLHMLNG